MLNYDSSRTGNNNSKYFKISQEKETFIYFTMHKYIQNSHFRKWCEKKALEFYNFSFDGA